MLKAQKLMVKICYFIQSHQNPEQVFRLARTIKQSAPESHILISHDFSSSYLDLSSLNHFSGIDLIKRYKPGIRGEFSLIQSYLDAIDWLFENNSDFDWLVYLSGQDYPVQPLTQVEDFLAKTDYDGFMQYWDIFEGEANPWGTAKGKRRYFSQYYRFPKWTEWFFKKISAIQAYTPIQYDFSFGVYVGWRTKNHPFNQDFKCYGGLIWSTLSRKSVQYFRDYLKKHPQLVQFYKRTILPEESLLPSILGNSQLNICKDHKRYVDFWSNLVNNPLSGCAAARVLSIQDYAAMTSDDFHFARKFDLNTDSQVLDLLDTKVLPTEGSANLTPAYKSVA